MKLLTKDVIEIEPPRMTRTSYDFVTDEGFINSVPLGIRRMDLKLKVQGTEPIAIALHHFNAGTVLGFDIHNFKGTAYVTSVLVHSPIDGLVTADIQLRLTGPVTIAKEEKKMKKTKVLNRFYVASDKMLSEAEQGSVNAGPQHSANEYYDGGGFERGRSRPRHTRWAKRDLSQAIDHAREILDNDPSKAEVAIVRIVKMVRRKATPIIVEDVK